MSSRPSRMTSVNWRYSSYFIIIPTLLLYVLSLTGCVSNSPGLQNIFLVALQHQNDNLTTTSTGAQLRVGYFAMTSLDKLASQLNSTINLSDVDVNQATALLSVALILQTKILLPLLAAGAGSSFFLGITFFILFNWTAKRPKANLTASSAKRLKFYMRGCLSFRSSVGLSIASAVSITESTAALQFWTANVPESSIIVSTGKAMQTLQWGLVALSALFALAVSSRLRLTGTGTLPAPGGNGFPPKGPPSGGGFQPPGQGGAPPPPPLSFQ